MDQSNDENKESLKDENDVKAQNDLELAMLSKIQEGTNKTANTQLEAASLLKEFGGSIKPLLNGVMKDGLKIGHDLERRHQESNMQIEKMTNQIIEIRADFKQDNIKRDKNDLKFRQFIEDQNQKNIDYDKSKRNMFDRLLPWGTLIVAFFAFLK